MRSPVFSWIFLLSLLPGCAPAISQSAAGHIRISPAPSLQPAPQSAAKPPAQPQDLIPTTLALNLCVDGSPVYPCPMPVTSDGTYIPSIALTYGQVLDGVVAYGPPGISSGTITIYKDTDAVCVLVIVPGVSQSCPPDSTIFDVGNYTLSATLTFPAGSPYLPFNTSVGPCATTPTCDVAITIAQDPTSIALTSSANPAALGNPVTFTALVTGAYPAIPTGQAIFTIDGTAAPAIPLDSSGAAALTASALALGPHTITAAYSGATDFLPAADAAYKQQIVPPATATAIASRLNPSTIGEIVTFSATVSTAAGLGVTPTGPVTFKDGTASFATVPLVPKGAQNVAQTSISTLAPGTHNVTAIYAGDAATSASVSPVLVEQVNYPLTMAPTGYRITVTPASISFFAGAAANLAVTVTPVSGFAGTVALSCSNLPNEAACTFADATIPTGGGSTTLTLTTMFPHDCGSSVPYGSFGPAVGLVLLSLPRRRTGKRSYRKTALLALIALWSLFPLSGCGSRCTDFGTAPGSYTFKVNGIASASVTGGNPISTPNVSVAVALTVKP